MMHTIILVWEVVKLIIKYNTTHDNLRKQAFNIFKRLFNLFWHTRPVRNILNQNKKNKTKTWQQPKSRLSKLQQC